MTKPPALELRQVSKTFGKANGQAGVHPAVQNVDLSLPEGEVLALLGPSGCGKTTILRLIAGFERPDEGQVRIGGQLAAGGLSFTPPEARGVGMVFQDYALFPHLSIGDNVTFGLKGLNRKQRAEKLGFILRLVGLEGRAADYPHQLSGGERQRVALARALVPEPRLLLLDEPLSSLDADLRMKMREDLRVLLKVGKLTAIFVTHDQEEALYLGDRLAVMSQGRVEQVGKPEDIFHQPATRFVAEFMGNSDFLPGRRTPHGVETEIGLIPQAVDAPEGADLQLVLRADDVRFEPQAGSPSIVLARHFRGAMNVYRLRLPSGRLLHAFAPHEQRLPPGTPVRIWVDSQHPLAWFESTDHQN